MKKRMLCLLALVLCLLTPLCAMAEEQAPDVTGVLKKYTALDLEPYLGKTVVVNFFTEWCYYCMQEMPDLKAVNDLYDPESFQMVLVHVWDGEDETSTENVKEKFGMQHMTFFEDTDRLVASMVGLQGYPATLVINPDGTLSAAQSGMVTLEALTSHLDAMGVKRAQEAQDGTV